MRIASAIVLLLTAFRMAWPAFAYSIEDDREARRTYSFVLTYVVFVCCWLALALGLLAPWILRLITTEPFYPAQNVVAPLAFGVAAFGAYVVVQIGTGRARQTRSNWLVTGAAAVVNVALNLALIPSYGRMGAAIATVVAYTLLFVGMAWRAQRVFPVPVPVAPGRDRSARAAVGLTVLGQAARRPARPSRLRSTARLPARAALLGFYLPAERRRIAAALAYPWTMSILAAILVASTSLNITVWPDGRGTAARRAYTLQCAPRRGDAAEARRRVPKLARAEAAVRAGAGRTRPARRSTAGRRRRS